MPELSRKRAKGSGQEKPSVELLFEEIFPLLLDSGHITTKDIKTLRSTCKRIKTAVDSFIKTKIDLGRPLPEDALSAPSFRQLELIRRSSVDEINFWDNYGQSLLSILKRSAPHLEMLNTNIKDGGDGILLKIFNENYAYPNLQSLKLKKAKPGTVVALQKSFCSKDLVVAAGVSMLMTSKL